VYFAQIWNIWTFVQMTWNLKDIERIHDIIGSPECSKILTISSKVLDMSRAEWTNHTWNEDTFAFRDSLYSDETTHCELIWLILAARSINVNSEIIIREILTSELIDKGVSHRQMFSETIDRVSKPRNIPNNEWQKRWSFILIIDYSSKRKLRLL